MKQNRSRSSNAGIWFWLLIAVFCLIGMGFILQPRIFHFSADQLHEESENERPVKLHWQVSFFSSDVTIRSDDDVYQVPPSGTLILSPKKTTFYTIEAANWLSRLLKSSSKEQLLVTVPEKLPEALLSLRSQRIKKNEYEVLWTVDQQALRGSLLIGEEKIILTPDNFSGSRAVSINQDTPIALTVERPDGTDRRDAFLTFEPEQMEIKKFALWVQPPDRKTGNATDEERSFSIKYAEIVSNSGQPAAFQFNRTAPDIMIHSGDKVLLEWDVVGAETVMIDPISRAILPAKGAKIFYPTKTTNFILSASAGADVKTAAIPLTLTDPIQTKTTSTPAVRYYGSSGIVRTTSTPRPIVITQKAPTIEFLNVNPSTLQLPGKVIISWSVKGEWTRIQLIAASVDELLSGHAPRLQQEHKETVIADYLPPAGFLTVSITGNTSFILRAWNQSKTDAASANIRVNDADSLRKEASLKITDIYPKKDQYQVGETINITATLEGAIPAAPPTGPIVLSDGLSYCQFALPRTSCDLTIRAAGTRTLTANYSGNGDYQPAKNHVEITSVLPQKSETQLRLSIFPLKPDYLPNDTVTITADFIGTAEPPSMADMKGTLYFSDGLSNCIVTLPRNTCDIKLRRQGTNTIRVNYSGDNLYQACNAALSAETIQKKYPTQLEISGIFPQKTTYYVGDQVDVYLDFEYDHSLSIMPANKIKITDGYANCQISPAGNNHCSLRFIDPDAGSISAIYLGDEFFESSQSIPFNIQLETAPKLTTRTTISEIHPSQETFKIGDKVLVTVEVQPEKTSELIPGGIVTVSDGFSQCEIDLNHADSCQLQLTNGTASQITALYGGDDTFAISSATPLPIRLIMVELSASIHAMTYDDCEHWRMDPDNPIAMQTDYSVTPSVEYFALDSRFSLGKGFYLQTQIQSYNGQFESDAGTITAEACSTIDPGYCVQTEVTSVFPDAADRTKGTALLEFPDLERAGNYHLHLSYSGDPQRFGLLEKNWSLRNVGRGILVLAPASEFQPNESYNAYGWTVAEASDLDAVDYQFRAYFLKGDLPGCPSALNAERYPQPAGITLDIRVLDTLPGSDKSDSEWQEAMLANGYVSGAIERLQPNRMQWGYQICRWEAADANWQIRCSNVGLNEHSIIRYALEHSDPNYRIADALDSDGISDISIQAAISRFLTLIHAPNFNNNLTFGDPYWLNSPNTDFFYWAAEYCPEIGETGIKLSRNGIPTDHILLATPFALTRQYADPDFRLRRLPEAVDLVDSSGAVLQIQPFYTGVCESCENLPMVTIDFIRNNGCYSPDPGKIIVTATNGKLFGGRTCDWNEYAHTNIQSTFCQAQFSRSGEIQLQYAETSGQLPQTDSYHITGTAGKGLSERTITNAGEKSSQDFKNLRQNLTLRPSFFDQRGNQVYEYFAGEPYTVRLQASEALNDDDLLQASLPQILSADHLDPVQSSCSPYIDFEKMTMQISGSEFSNEKQNTFQCTIVFANVTEELAPQTVHFVLTDAGGEKMPFLTPFSWSGLPTAIQKRQLTYYAALLAGMETVCDSNSPQCNGLYADEIYRLRIQLDHLLANNNKAEAGFVVDWPRNAAGSGESPCLIDDSSRSHISFGQRVFDAGFAFECEFILSDSFEETPTEIRIKGDASVYEFSPVALSLPAEYTAADIRLVPSLMLRLNPQDDAGQEQLNDGKLAVLYRSLESSAAYTLQVAVQGVPAFRKIQPDDAVLIRWKLLDRLHDSGSLSDCFVPTESGEYRISEIQPDGIGGWQTRCTFWIPPDFPIDHSIGNIQLWLDSTPSAENLEIQVEPHPFIQPIIQAAVSVPTEVYYGTGTSIQIALSAENPQTSRYVKALLDQVKEPLFGFQSTMPELTHCAGVFSPQSSILHTCDIQIMELSAADTDRTVEIIINPTRLNALLQLNVIDAETGQPQTVFTIPPVTRNPAALEFSGFFLDSAPEVRTDHIPAGTSGFAEIFFTGTPDSFQPENLMIWLDGRALQSCLLDIPHIYCPLPDPCSFPEEPNCSGDHELSFQYTGDLLNDSTRIYSESFRSDSFQLTFNPDPVGGLSKIDLFSIMRGSNDESAWEEAAIDIGGYTIKQYLLRKSLGSDGQLTKMSYPLIVAFDLPDQAVPLLQPDLFQLEIIVLQSTADGTIENSLLLYPIAVDLTTRTLTFALDFADSLQQSDGRTTADILASASHINEFLIHYEGSTGIQAASQPLAMENLPHPLPILSATHFDLLIDQEHLILQSPLPEVADNASLALYCSQPGEALRCGKVLAEDPENESFESDCWGGTELEWEESISLPVINPRSPRCIWVGVNGITGFDQLWIADSFNSAY